MSTIDPHVPLLDAALMTLDTYRSRSRKMSAATATWRSSDAARIIAALPAVGLALVMKDALERDRELLAAALPFLEDGSRHGMVVDPDAAPGRWATAESLGQAIRTALAGAAEPSRGEPRSRT